MRLTLPLPFGELTVSITRTRRARPLFWYTLLSAALHLIAITAFVRLALSSLLPRTQQPPIMVSMSSALPIERRERPQPARQPTRQQQTPVARRTAPQAERATQEPQKAAPVPTPENPAPRPRPADKAAVNLEQDRKTYAQVAARLSANDNPSAGLAVSSARPASSKRYTLDIAGADAKPQPEGILYPQKRWSEGAYVYYYVTYLVYYADGTTETGSVPWPIRYLLSNDPFARGIHHMPLPGPPSNYILPSDVSVTPLVRDCYDHHYEYCPIEHEAAP